MCNFQATFVRSANTPGLRSHRLRALVLRKRSHATRSTHIAQCRQRCLVAPLSTGLRPRHTEGRLRLVETHTEGGMPPQILELYPQTGTTRALDGTYLAHDLHLLGTPAQPFVYANFASSLDGRIAVVEADTGESYVLEDLTSGHDWRLFQELQAQADCMVTHGGYLRALAARKFEDILQVGIANNTLDIGRWRQEHG